MRFTHVLLSSLLVWTAWTAQALAARPVWTDVNGDISDSELATCDVPSLYAVIDEYLGDGLLYAADAAQIVLRVPCDEARHAVGGLLLGRLADPQNSGIVQNAMATPAPRVYVTPVVVPPPPPIHRVHVVPPPPPPPMHRHGPHHPAGHHPGPRAHGPHSRSHAPAAAPGPRAHGPKSGSRSQGPKHH